MYKQCARVITSIIATTTVDHLHIGTVLHFFTS